MMLCAANSVTITSHLELIPLFKVCRGQDGAIFGDCLFRFETDGRCFVYSIREKRQIGDFCLPGTDLLKPHSNAVAFGAERYDEADEFPLLYTNIYNNYAKQSERLEGVCCVYRITRDGNTFAAALVQVIRIGFVEDLALWKSLPGQEDVRPYGNFVPDIFRGKLYAFVMRDRDFVSRSFGRARKGSKQKRRRRFCEASNAAREHPEASRRRRRDATIKAEGMSK